MRKARTILLSAAVCLAAGFIGACGLFDTREPLEPPPPVSGCRALTGGPTLAVIPNIEDFYGRTSGATCYNSLVDTSFLFHPDAQDSSVALPETPYIGWDEVVEGRVNSNIANAQDFMEVDFLSEYSSAIISPDQTTEVRFYDYQLRISLQTAPDTLRFTGLADITFHRGADGQWKMTGWVDHRGAVNDSTWGSLRREYRVGF